MTYPNSCFLALDYLLTRGSADCQELASHLYAPAIHRFLPDMLSNMIHGSPSKRLAEIAWGNKCRSYHALWKAPFFMSSQEQSNLIDSPWILTIQFLPPPSQRSSNIPNNYHKPQLPILRPPPSSPCPQILIP